MCANSSTIIFWLSEAYNRNIEYKEIFDRIVLPPSTLHVSVWVEKKRRVFAFGGGRRSNVECVRSATREESMDENKKHENIYYEWAAEYYCGSDSSSEEEAREDDSKKNSKQQKRRGKKQEYTKKLQLSASVCSACREHHTREWEEGYMYVI